MTLKTHTIFPFECPHCQGKTDITISANEEGIPTEARITVVTATKDVLLEVGPLRLDAKIAAQQAKTDGVPE